MRRQEAMKRIFQSFLFALIIGAIAVAAVAQSTTANVRGKVTDGSGALLAGATVTAVATDSGFVKTATAAADGAFQLGGLNPGEYKITVAAQGFEARSETVRV